MALLRIMLDISVFQSRDFGDLSPAFWLWLFNKLSCPFTKQTHFPTYLL